MTVTAVQTVCIGILSVFSGASFGLSALGIAIIFEVGYYFLGSMDVFKDESLTEANSLLTIALLPIVAVESVYLRGQWNIKWSLLFGISAASFTVLGIDILSHTDGLWLERSLGIFLLSTFFILLYIQYRHKQSQSSTNNLNAKYQQTGDIDIEFEDVDPTLTDNNNSNNSNNDSNRNINTNKNSNSNNNSNQDSNTNITQKPESQQVEETLDEKLMV